MQALIVYAHPEPTSFTAALKDTAVRALSAAGHRVEVSDLYGEGFNPVAGRHDFIAAADQARFHYQSEQLHASRTCGFSAELVREQARLQRADLVVLVFPLWWGGLPAIVKGWFDRVCAYGVVYADGKRFDQGFFVGRRAMLGVTTGGTLERFSSGGGYGPIREVLYPVQRCMLEYLGLEVMEPFVAYAAPRVDTDIRNDYLRSWESRVLAAIGDRAWQSRLVALSDKAAQNQVVPEGQAWAARR
jgi:NAD(P)H dehydrogenase (quinone)